LEGTDFSNHALVKMPSNCSTAKVYEYLISLNDKEITDNRPDALKIESAGFDLKTSFRKGKN
jgi:hypothetical protein